MISASASRKRRWSEELQPFEDDHLGRHDLRAVLFHAADRRLLTLGPARAQSVPDEEDMAAQVEEAEHRLQDADMRLAAGNDEVSVRRNPV